MTVRITSPAEYDRHEAEIRFVAHINGAPKSVTMTESALFIACEARGVVRSDPIADFAVVGGLVEKVIADIVKQVGSSENTYLVTNADIL